MNPTEHNSAAPQRSNITTILFDLDGTLTHFEVGYFIPEAQRIFGGLGYTVDVSHVLSAFQRGNIFELFPHEGRTQLVTKFWEDYRFQGYPHPRAFDGVDETLAELARMGLRMAIVTARVETPAQIRQLLAPTGIDAYFERIISHESNAPYAKDKTGLIAQVLRDLDRQPFETLMVGDSGSDIVSGKLAGLALTVGVTSGGVEREVIESFAPDYVLESVLELPSLLRARTRGIVGEA